MSKTRTLRVVVIAAITSLLLALSAWAVTFPARADGEGASADTFTLGGANKDGINLKVGLTPFIYTHDSDGEADDGNVDKTKVVIYSPDKTKYTNPSHVRFEGASKTIKMYFLSINWKNVSDDQSTDIAFDFGSAEKGTTITFASDFSVTGVACASATDYDAANAKTYTVAKSETYTFDGDVWYKGEEKSVQLGNASVNGITISFAMNPFVPAGNNDEDLYNSEQMKPNITLHIPDDGEGKDLHPSHIRAQSAANSLQLYFLNNPDIDNNISKAPVGSTITIKKEFVFVGRDGAKYNIGDSDYVYTLIEGLGWVDESTLTGQETITLGNVTAQRQETGPNASTSKHIYYVGVTPFGHAGAAGTGETEIGNFAIMKTLISLDTPGKTLQNPTNIRTEVASGGLKIYINRALKKGSVFTIKKGFKFVGYDGKIYSLNEDYVRIYNGSEFVEKATGFELSENENTIPQYAEFTPLVTFAPAGSFALLEYTSDNTDVVEVDGNTLIAKTAGTANVSVKMSGADDNTAKTVAVTVTAAEKKIVLVNDRIFRVQKGGTLDVSKLKVKVCYGKGSGDIEYYGDEISLSSENAVVSGFDFTKAGKGNATVTVTLTDHGEEVQNDIYVKVEVPEIQEIYPNNFSCVEDGHGFGKTLVFYFGKTFTNQANVYTTALTPEAVQNANEHILINFPREGQDVKLDVQGFITQMLFIRAYTGNNPNDSESQIGKYEDGDSITLKAGLQFYGWFGDVDGWNVPQGEGEYIKVGELGYDAVFTYKSGKWSWQIAPADGKVLEEKVTVGLQEQHRANVEIVPLYATHGEWFYTVEDASVATIDTQGLISGRKIGTTRVTAVLKDRTGAEVKTVQFEIEVTDSVKSLKITADKQVVLASGTDLDVAKLVSDFGVKGKVLMTSGAEGKEVDLTNAKVTGYKADVDGKQTITFRLTVDGKSVTGSLEITVGNSKKGGCGCGSTVASVSSLIAAGAVLLTAALLTLRKRKQEN